MKILFVCTGNTCRSPMAQYLLRHLLKEEGISTVHVDSAGLFPAPHLGFPNEARHALEEDGVYVDAHRAKGVSAADVETTDLILVMETKHAETLKERFPAAQNKIYRLNEFAGLGESDIEDPYGQPLGAYKRILADIRKALQNIIAKLKVETK